MTTNTSKNLRLAVGAIVKESSETLLEWIAYHRVVGVDYFWIADNGSGIAARQLLLDLDRLGIISYMHFPSKVDANLQLSAYRKILARARNFKGLLAFIDADEFLVSDGNSLRPHMEEIFRDENISALALNWAKFGSSGALFAEEGLVIERFTRRARQNNAGNRHFKSIVRPERVNDFLNPHLVSLRQGRYVGSDGRDLMLNSKCTAGMSDGVSWNGARINHYIIKSLEEFLLDKHLRGDVADINHVIHRKYFIKNDINDEECLLAARLAPLVRAEISRLETKCGQLRSLIHPNLIRLYPYPKSAAALQWQNILPSKNETREALSVPARTAVLLEENLTLRRLIKELNIFNLRLFRSFQYRIGSTIVALIRTLLGRTEKRSWPEIQIRQTLKKYERLRKVP
jgi:hypothetical protein